MSYKQCERIGGDFETLCCGLVLRLWKTDAEGANLRQGGGAYGLRSFRRKAAQIPGHRDNSARNSDEFLTSVSLRTRFGEPSSLPGICAVFHLELLKAYAMPPCRRFAPSAVYFRA